MAAGGLETPDHQTWGWNPIEDVANIGSDIAGFVTGPSGDPGRIRHAAKQVEDLSARFDVDRRAIDESVGELLRTWQGDSAANFAARWYEGEGGRAPTAILADAKQKLDGFAKQLNDYADRLEHEQHEHWIQTVLMAGLTVANLAQMGLDPVSDAAEVGLATAGWLALTEGGIGAVSDLAGQFGADAWDHIDQGFDETGDHAVGLFDPAELIVATASGAVAGGMMGGSALVVNRVVRRSLARTGAPELGPAAPATEPVSLGASESWGDPATLADHFSRHGNDFGATTKEEYADQASQFLQRSQDEMLPTKVDANGVIRVYDPATNEFGSFNPDGTTRTYFAPNPLSHGYATNWDYWSAQRGASP